MVGGKRLASALISLRWILIYVAAVWFLFLPDQIIDALSVLGENERSTRWQRVVFVGCAWCLLLNIAIWADSILAEHKLEVGSGRYRRLLPLLAGSGIVLACLRTIPNLTPHQAMIISIVAGFVLVGAVGIALLPDKLFEVGRFLPAESKRFKLNLKGIGRAATISFLASSAIYFGLCGWFFQTQGQGAEQIGSLALVMFAFAALLSITSFLQVASRRSQLPIIPILATWGLMFTVTDWNDNSRVRTLPNVQTGAPPLDQAFKQWLANRTDKPAAGKPFPVFIVATEGGGIRSAYLTALTLCRIQDRYPAFAQHVFAISGVSGGSVGGSIFAALCRKHAVNQDLPPTGLPWSEKGPLERELDKIFQRDWLAPVLATAMYQDMIQGWLPAVGHVDRSKALERAIERAFRSVTGEDTFAKPFSDLHEGFASGAMPALFLNTTTEDNGERLVIAGLSVAGPKEDPIFYTVADRDSSLNLPLSTAAVLSARFPVVTASGLLPISRKEDRQDVRVLDGGYYDNSGCATAMNIMQLLELAYRGVAKPPFEVVIVRIGYGVHGPAWKGSSGPEPLSPVVGLFNARDGRATDAVRQLRTYMKALEKKDQTGPRMIEFHFDARTAKLPLGWLLSTRSMEIAKTQLDSPRESQVQGDTRWALSQIVERMK